VRLRYIGASPITFVEAGELEPGAEFNVPDDQADGYLRRDDIEEAPPEPEPDPAPAKASRKASKPTETAADAAPEE
jgi:hypothetical protein